MYYEEDFGMAEYPNGSWEQEGTPQEDYQEPGVVGMPVTVRMVQMLLI